MPWCSLSFASLLTRREKSTMWSQMIPSGFLLTQSEHLTHCCTAITKDKNVRMKEAMCSRYSIQTRSSLVPVYMGFSYLHFLCACEHTYSLICDHIRKCGLCGFCTWWILLCRLQCLDNKDKIMPFFPWSQTWEPKLFSIGRVGFLRTSAVSVCLSAALAEILGLLWHPKDIACCHGSCYGWIVGSFGSRVIETYAYHLCEHAHGDFYAPQGWTSLNGQAYQNTQDSHKCFSCRQNQFHTDSYKNEPLQLPDWYIDSILANLG